MSLRKIVLLISIAIVFGFYMIVMDPFSNSKMLEDIPFGYALLFSLKVFLLAAFLIVLNNIIMDVLMDDEYRLDDKELAKLAAMNSRSAANLMIAKSIRYMSSAIIVLGVLIYCSKE